MASRAFSYGLSRAPPEIKVEGEFNNLISFLGTYQRTYLFEEGGGSTALLVSFRFERSPCVEAALEGVWLAERRSYEIQFSVVDKV